MGEGVFLDVLLSGDICTCTHREMYCHNGGWSYHCQKGGARVGVAYD